MKRFCRRKVGLNKIHVPSPTDCRIHVQWTLLLFSLLVIGVTSSAFAEGKQIQDSPDTIARYESFLTVYTGVAVQEDIGDVFALRSKFEDNAYVGVVALAHQFWHYEKLREHQCGRRRGHLILYRSIKCGKKRRRRCSACAQLPNVRTGIGPATVSKMGSGGANSPSFVGVRVGRALRVRIKLHLWRHQVQFLGSPTVNLYMPFLKISDDALP